MVMPRSTALHMSYTVNRATWTAVSASISTPVGPTVSTVAVHSTEGAKCSVSSNQAKSIATRVNASGWHSGMSSLVFFAAMMPATRAMPSTSPFFAVPLRTRSRVAACITMRPLAMAIRWVAGLAATSTMWAWPCASKWVSGLEGGMIGAGQQDQASLQNVYPFHAS